MTKEKNPMHVEITAVQRYTKIRYENVYVDKLMDSVLSCLSAFPHCLGSQYRLDRATD